jgi:phage baseplate assembly protein W
MDAEFLGRGWAFPVTSADDADVRMVEEAEDVRQAILLILETEPGERVMRPDFGAGLRGLVFEPMSSRLMALIRYRVTQGLTTWEPRITLHEVNVEVTDPALGRLRVEIRYAIRATNTFYNLVYPFYLSGRSP